MAYPATAPNRNPLPAEKTRSSIDNVPAIPPYKFCTDTFKVSFSSLFVYSHIDLTRT
jgi:hypothetical protein